VARRPQGQTWYGRRVDLRAANPLLYCLLTNYLLPSMKHGGATGCGPSVDGTTGTYDERHRMTLQALTAWKTVRAHLDQVLGSPTDTNGASRRPVRAGGCGTSSRTSDRQLAKPSTRCPANRRDADAGEPGTPARPYGGAPARLVSGSDSRRVPHPRATAFQARGFTSGQTNCYTAVPGYRS
jgi:hypothetical protein